jgi:undecaprenyl-diphosphatase
MNLILFYAVLGAIQGITEWLPISSSAFLSFILSSYFPSTNLSEIIHVVLFFHLGTFLAALVYFRKDVFHLIKSLFKYKKAEPNTKKVLNFLIVSTLISGILGIIILKFLSNLEITGKYITIFVGCLLLITAFIQFSVKKIGIRTFSNLKFSDGILLGLLQGLAVMPGISRSGITVSGLLLDKFDDTVALKLSFLMSLPIVLAGNIILNFSDFQQIFTMPSIIGLVISFVFGILTIHLLIKLAKKINFAWFALIFGLLMLGSLVF